MVVKAEMFSKGSGQPNKNSVFLHLVWLAADLVLLATDLFGLGMHGVVTNHSNCMRSNSMS